MKLPRLNAEEPPDGQRDRLARWLAEWEIDDALAAVGAGASEPQPDAGAVGELAADIASTEDGPVPAPGQVRLFSPEPRAARHRALYVALLAWRGEDVLLAAPYGRFSEPAVPGELLTVRDTPALRVLCPWNARPLTVTLLQRTWFVDKLDDGETAEAVDLHRCMEQRHAIPAELRHRIGPPLRHPADPRHTYLRQERIRMDLLVRESGAGGVSDGGLAYPTHSPEENLRLAAESGEEYGSDE